MPPALTELASTLHRAASLLQAIDDVADAGPSMPPPLRGICVETAHALMGAAQELLQIVNRHADLPAPAEPGGRSDTD